MMKKMLVAVIMLVVVACKKDADQVLNQQDLIRIEFDMDTSALFADNSSVLQFRAIIPSETKEQFRSVTFSATEGLGEFQGTTADKKNVVLADQAGTAKTAIKLGTKPGYYFLSAQITSDGKTFKSQDYLIRLQTLKQDELIKLEIVSDIANLRADNESVIQFKATIPRNSTGETRTVTFITTQGLGTFEGTGATVIANQDGEALANIKVGGTGGKYFVAAEVKIGERTYRTSDQLIELLPVAASEKIRLEPDNFQPVADGFTIVHLRASIHFVKDKKIVLTTSAGTFLQSAAGTSIVLEADDQGIAETDLRVSSEVKPHVITATVAETPPVSIIINPEVSFAEDLLIEPGASSIDSGGAAVQIKTVLKKILPERLVSKNTLVSFRAYQVVGGISREVGRFTGLASSLSTIDGSVPSVNFFADTPNLDISEPITIEASAPKNATEKLTKTIQLSVKGN
ncbi:MAG: hypothetical protein EOO88_15145 [Pedobacter sp.]|nr:MAG: hypothetical protein EOO88_15145 [Pedobacter sp.]